MHYYNDYTDIIGNNENSVRAQGLLREEALRACNAHAKAAGTKIPAI